MVIYHMIYFVFIKKTKAEYTCITYFSNFSLSQRVRVTSNHPLSVAVVVNYNFFFDFSQNDACTCYKFCVNVQWIDP